MPGGHDYSPTVRARRWQDRHAFLSDARPPLPAGACGILPRKMTSDIQTQDISARQELRRIEAFSDGVFAIACTLLVLEFKVPHVAGGSGSLWPALKAAWPSFVAYALSFWSILLAWAGHHRALSALVGTSRALLYSNGILLMTITFIPFPTAVLAEYINTPQANVAVMFYSGVWLVVNVAFNVWWQSMLRPIRLIFSLSDAALTRATLQTSSGLLIYSCTTTLAFWFPVASLMIILASQILWVVVSVEDGIARR